MAKREKLRGMLGLNDLRKLVDDDGIETVLTVFPDLYGRLVGKRMTARFFLDGVVDHGLHACDYLLACDMEMDPVPGYKFTSWARGYGDVHCVPDMDTLRHASWLDKTAIVLCDVYRQEKLVDIAPRTLLRNQIDRARDMGFTPKGASELELYLFKDSYEEVTRKQFVGLEPMGSYLEDYHILQGTKEESLVGAIRSHLQKSGIPVEGSKGEWGPGQQEIGIPYSDFLEMADRHVLYKHAAKEIAWQQGRAVTFMAKWDERYAGSSCHIHASLWSADGTKPMFKGNQRLGPIRCSKTFRHFLGGWMKHLRETFAFYAPYPASYKRYVAGSFAPTGIAWSYDNRTAGFRIVGEGSSLRIECRAAGADANVYLAFAATLAAGLDGIEQEIEPPEMFEGDGYAAQNLAQVPRTLNEAIRELEASDWSRQVFGSETVEHYLHFFRTEQRKFDEVVTDWERRRYFERA